MLLCCLSRWHTGPPGYNTEPEAEPAAAASAPASAVQVGRQQEVQEQLLRGLEAQLKEREKAVSGEALNDCAAVHWQAPGF